MIKEKVKRLRADHALLLKVLLLELAFRFSEINRYCKFKSSWEDNVDIS